MSSPGQFANKVIALTGAASGIGLATAHLLAFRGAVLSLADLQPEALERARAAITAAHPAAQVSVHALDVRDYPAVQAWIDSTVSTHGRLDGAANLAGVVPPSIGKKTIAEQDPAEWEFVQGVNVTGVMHCLKAQLGAIADGGSVVNASSIAGLIGLACNASYVASKHAVLGLTRTAAKEFGARQVRVNAICPGMIDTPMLRSAGPERTAQVALKRNGKPEEVANLIAFLLSDESTYMSGASISIDGGWNC